jgi:hypothetical protein
MGGIDEYNDIDIFVYSGQLSEITLSVNDTSSMVQIIEYNNVILPSMHFGKYVALTHDLDCVRFFGIYNHRDQSMEIYGTKMALVSLMRRTNYISLYAATIKSVMERAKKYKKRCFKYELEMSTDVIYGYTGNIGERYCSDNDMHSTLMFEHGVEYHPYNEVMDLSKIKTIYISDIARYIPRPCLSSLFMLLTTGIPIIGEYRDMINMYKEDVVEATGGDEIMKENPLIHVLNNIDCDKELKVKKLMLKYSELPSL